MHVIDLVRRIDDAWLAFRAAVTAHRGGLEERTSVGWRYRDLVAHVLGWEGETARRLAIFRVDGVQFEPFLGADELNAESVARYSRLSVGGLLDELDRTHELLLGEVRNLSEAQLRHNQSWAESVVAGNTYRHYAEHARELA
ncbi:MAG: hypothetical protein AUH85_12780 [Chloroflexi bacterium 13_1_40CM_4_68_4]|nr:MAG: hypothetical protein AUH85_12780 [Chloroflexi bacterium 13_1_40CM_4_68_4]